MKRWPFFFALVALSGLCASPRSARADTASEAQLQSDLGTELYNDKRYNEALEHFIASFRLVPNANVAFNIAGLFEFLGKPKDAFNWFVSTERLSAEEELRTTARAAMERLAPKVAVVRVETSPEGAELFVERIDLGSVGSGPLRLAVEPGACTILARHPGYRDASHGETIAQGEEKTIKLELAALMGSVEVTTSPPGASVRLENDPQLLGTTPLVVELPIGERRLTITHPGFVEQTKTVTIADGQKTALRIELVRAASSVAVLTLAGNVPGALVELDRKPIGKAPLSLPDLLPGSHRVRISAEGREPWSTDVVLEAGGATRIDYSLADPDERVWPGYRWIGYGAAAGLIVAGSIVGITALNATDDFYRDPSSGDLDSVHERNRTADMLLGGGVAVLTGVVLWDLLRSPDPVSTGNVTVD